jgi:hypothetical protein
MGSESPATAENPGRRMMPTAAGKRDRAAVARIGEGIIEGAFPGCQESISAGKLVRLSQRPAGFLDPPVE